MEAKDSQRGLPETEAPILIKKASPMRENIAVPVSIEGITAFEMGSRAVGELPKSTYAFDMPLLEPRPQLPSDDIGERRPISNKRSRSNVRAGVLTVLTGGALWLAGRAVEAVSPTVHVVMDGISAAGQFAWLAVADTAVKIGTVVKVVVVTPLNFIGSAIMWWSWEARLVIGGIILIGSAAYLILDHKRRVQDRENAEMGYY